MSGNLRPPLRVALVVPRAPALSLGVLHGAARLARWIEADPRMVLAGISDVDAPVVRQSAAAMMAAERRLMPRARRLGPPPPLPRAGAEPADVIVDLSGRVPSDPGGTPATARYGTWTLSAHAPLAGFAEVAERASTTVVSLFVALGQATERIAVARYGTKPLASLNADFIAEKSVQLVRRELSQLHAKGALPQPEGGASVAGRALPTGGPVQTARYAMGVAATAATRLRRAVPGLSGRAGPGFGVRLCEGLPHDFDPVSGTDLVPPPGHFWADPFLFEHRGTLYLFFEEYGPAVGRGVLKVGRLGADGLEVLGAPITAPHHLSYPFVFEADGQIWMMPETIGAGRLEIFRAADFPLRWERAATAFEGTPPADCILVRHQGAWWLFANMCDDSFGDYCSELHLFRVDGPKLGRIEPHPLNPVVIDATTARGGGRIWSENGRLYRASQDNSHGIYGWGLNLMEVTRLDMGGYAERRVRQISPETVPGVLGCHHLDFAAGKVAIDVRHAARTR